MYRSDGAAALVGGSGGEARRDTPRRRRWGGVSCARVTPPPSMALLRHELPDGSWHFDWMFDAGPERAGLVAFRVGERIDARATGGFDATRLEDHRREYLEYEGPVSGGRGVVMRMGAGACEVEEESAGRMVVVVDWGAGPRRWEGRRAGATARWRFVEVEG